MSWNTGRTGWNQRGGSNNYHLHIQLMEARRREPNGEYWAEQARASMARLMKVLGEDDYALWAEMTWPGDTVEKHTWKELAEQLSKAVGLADTLLLDMECSCNGVTDLCEVCQAYQRLHSSTSDGLPV